MMIGERNHSNPTVHVPPWSFSDDPTAENGYYNINNNNNNANFLVGNNNNPPLDDFALLSLQRFLPSNNHPNDAVLVNDDVDFPVDGFSCDQFRMYDFKVRKCTRGRSHDWTECPFAHPGEKARRRDPRKYHYSGTACPEYRKGGCKKGDCCEFAHGVFECWLHPARYRTQPCKDGLNCKRRVCFFAHSPDQLRVLSPRSGNFSSGSEVFDSCLGSNSPPTESPPMSPMSPMNVQSLSRSLGSGSGSINEMVANLRQLQLNKVKGVYGSWGLEAGCSPPSLGSPRLGMIRPGFCSLPNTPTRAVTRPGIGYFDAWEEEEEPVMERVESGRGLRAKMFEKLSKENSLDSSGSGQDPNLYESANPDVGWVTDLLQ
ncbi:hypothetical protein LIER_12602 [Lithospermum erythrorhizon]|uniref:C3H1-type domain-containing protein n=1 Tax=Lithospermum erythrorhizon TaxID=34254 RepID=A0AAV3PXK4_LITER